MRTAFLASALVVAWAGTSLAQTATSPAVANPPSQGKAAPTSNDTSKMKASGSTGGAMSKSATTPGGEMGPSGQQAKPK